MCDFNDFHDFYVFSMIFGQNRWNNEKVSFLKIQAPQAARWGPCSNLLEHARTCRSSRTCSFKHFGVRCSNMLEHARTRRGGSGEPKIHFFQFFDFLMVFEIYCGFSLKCCKSHKKSKKYDKNIKNIEKLLKIIKIIKIIKKTLKIIKNE